MFKRFAELFKKTEEKKLELINKDDIEVLENENQKKKEKLLLLNNNLNKHQSDINEINNYIAETEEKTGLSLSTNNNNNNKNNKNNYNDKIKAKFQYASKILLAPSIIARESKNELNQLARSAGKRKGPFWMTDYLILSASSNRLVHQIEEMSEAIIERIHGFKPISNIELLGDRLYWSSKKFISNELWDRISLILWSVVEYRGYSCDVDENINKLNDMIRPAITIWFKKLMYDEGYKMYQFICNNKLCPNLDTIVHYIPDIESIFSYIILMYGIKKRSSKKKFNVPSSDICCSTLLGTICGTITDTNASITLRENAALVLFNMSPQHLSIHIDNMRLLLCGYYNIETTTSIRLCVMKSLIIAINGINQSLKDFFNQIIIEMNHQNMVLCVAKYGYTEVMEIMLEYDIDYNQKDIDGSSLLWLAAAGGHGSMINLLSKYLDIYEVNNNGISPLIAACRYDGGDSIEYFIKLGVNINIPTMINDEKDDPPLIIAVKYGSLSVISSLIKNGAKKSILSKEGLGALATSIIYKKSSSANILLKYGISIRSNDILLAMEYNLDVFRSMLLSQLHKERKSLKKLVSDQYVEASMMSCLDVRFDEEQQYTYLMEAARNGHAPAVTILLDLGADPTLRDTNNKCAYKLAEDNDHFEIASKLRYAIENWKDQQVLDNANPLYKKAYPIILGRYGPNIYQSLFANNIIASNSNIQDFRHLISISD